MTIPARDRREADLVAYYDDEVHDRIARELPARRVERRDAFLSLLHGEGRRSVVEVGTGPGRDGDAFVAAGFDYSGVDLAPGSVAVCRARGLDVRVASVLGLPFADGAFDAGWTMSTLLHVADEDLDRALAEIVRVLRPASPFAVGLWGDGSGGEHLRSDRDGTRPPRYFALRTDDGLRAALDRHGTVERWETWAGDGAVHYQWAVVRTPG